MYNVISWKYSLERLDKELELTNKKKQALENLFSTGKISQGSYENLNTELTGVVIDIENRRKTLVDKITSKINDLEQQTAMLEKLFAESEIRQAAGEADDESYAHESNVLTLGLEATKQQLAEIKMAVDKLVPKEAMPTPPTPAEAVEPSTIEEIVEKPSEIPVEAPVEVPVAAPVEAPVETPAEAETVSEEAEIEQPIEVISDEAPGEGEAEAAREEEFQPSEEVVDETVATSETSVETVVEEGPTEEKVKAPAEETSPFQGEEEATTEEEKTEEQP